MPGGDFRRPRRMSASSCLSLRSALAHSGEQVTVGVFESNTLPQMMQTQRLLRASRFCLLRLSRFSALYCRDLARMWSATTVGAHSLQYRCLALLTMYSLPQHSHLSVLPSLREVPLRFARRFASFARTARQSGQYHARGPPWNTIPHCRQVRGRTDADLK